MKSRFASITGWTCAILVSAFTLFSAVMEFIPVTDPAMIAYVERLGVGPIAYQLGIAKIVLVALYLWPRMSTVGFVLLIGYFGGALATNITHQFPVADYSPIFIIFILMTVSAYFRNPELLSRALNRPVPEKI